MLWGFIARYAPGTTPEQLAAAGGPGRRTRSPTIATSWRRPAATAPPTDQERAALEELHGWLGGAGADADAEAIQYELYEIGKRHGFANLRDWFRALYEVLLGQSEGPRFGTFVAIYGTAETPLADRARPRARGRGRMTERPPDRRAAGARRARRPRPAQARPRAKRRPRRRRPRPISAGRSAPTRGGWRWTSWIACSGPDHRPFDETFQGHPQLGQARRPRPGLRADPGHHRAAPAGPDRSHGPAAAALPAQGAARSPTCCGWVPPSSCSSRPRRTPRWPRRCASPPAASGARSRCSMPCCASSRPRGASCSRARTRHA